MHNKLPLLGPHLVFENLPSQIFVPLVCMYAWCAPFRPTMCYSSGVLINKTIPLLSEVCYCKHALSRAVVFSRILWYSACCKACLVHMELNPPLPKAGTLILTRFWQVSATVHAALSSVGAFSSAGAPSWEQQASVQERRSLLRLYSWFTFPPWRPTWGTVCTGVHAPTSAYIHAQVCVWDTYMACTLDMLFLDHVILKPARSLKHCLDTILGTTVAGIPKLIAPSSVRDPWGCTCLVMPNTFIYKTASCPTPVILRNFPSLTSLWESSGRLRPSHLGFP